MSGRSILSRPRTKIYDSNYSIGESYYKSALDRMDRKYSGRPLSPPRHSSAIDIADRHARIFAEDNLEDSRRRASNRIRENHLFDSRGARLRRGSDYLDEDGITDETASTLQRIRAAKKVSYIDDVDLESTSNNLRTQRLLDRSEKILDSIGLNESSASKRALENEFSYQKRSMKISQNADGDNITKWAPVAPQENGESTTSSLSLKARRSRAKLEDNDESTVSSAAIRARQSRARIDDIEDEMAAMQEKQAARERRVARLKQLVAECDAETVDDSGVATSTLSVTEKKVRF